MEKINIKFARVNKDKDCKIPSKRKGDAGYDIYASFEEDHIKIPAHSTALIPTNLAYSIPEDKYFQIEERGSTGSKGIKKSAGVLDSNYTGEIFVAITNTNSKDVIIAKDSEKFAGYSEIIYPYEKAIAQLVLHDVFDTEEQEVDYDEILAKNTDRGTGALGSSGK